MDFTQITAMNLLVDERIERATDVRFTAIEQKLSMIEQAMQQVASAINVQAGRIDACAEANADTARRADEFEKQLVMLRGQCDFLRRLLMSKLTPEEQIALKTLTDEESE